MSPEEERGGEKNAIYSGHLRLCQQPRAAHALRSDQYIIDRYYYYHNDVYSVYTDGYIQSVQR